MSNEIMKGVVERVHGPNKNGFYAILLSGNKTWFSMGKVPPKASSGDSVSFEFTRNGNFCNADPKTLEVVLAAQTSAKSAGANLPTQQAKSISPKTQSTSSGLDKDAYWRRREEQDVEERSYRRARDAAVQNEIRFQAARNAAIEFLGLCVTNGWLDLPAATSAKKNQMLTSAKLYLDKITEDFYEDTLEVNRVEEEKKEIVAERVSSPEEDF